MPDVIADLWPQPDKMKEYVDGWAALVAKQAARIRELEVMAARADDSYSREIAKLRNELEHINEPLQAEIIRMQYASETMRSRIADLERERTTAIEWLTKVTESGPNGSLLDLISDCTTIVEHSKRMIRDRL